MCDSPRTGCAPRITAIYTWWEQAITEWLRRGISADTNLWTIEQNDQRTHRVIAAHDLYCCLLPQCEALRTCRSQHGRPLGKSTIFPLEKLLPTHMHTAIFSRNARVANVCLGVTATLLGFFHLCDVIMKIPSLEVAAHGRVRSFQRLQFVELRLWCTRNNGGVQFDVDLQVLECYLASFNYYPWEETQDCVNSEKNYMEFQWVRGIRENKELSTGVASSTFSTPRAGCN